MSEFRALKITKGDEYKVNAQILFNFLLSLNIDFFNNFDIQIKKTSDNEWIIKILNEENEWEEVKFS